jgi:MFS family permease
VRLPAAAGAGAAGVTVGWNVGNIGAIPETVAGGYGVSLAAVGFLTTAMFVTHLSIQLPGGRLIDRVGARRIAIVGICIIGSMNALALIAPEFGLGLTARALTGFGTGLTFLAGSDYVRSMIGSAFAQGLYGGINLATGGIALAVVPLFESALEWRAPFATAAVLSIFSLTALLASPRDCERRVEPGGLAAPPRARIPLRELRPGGLFPLVAIQATSFGLNVVVANWVVVLLERAGDYSTRQAAAVGALTLLGGVVSRPLGGWIMRERPDEARPLIAISLVAGGAATAVLAWAGPLPMMVLAGAVVGIAAGIPFAPAFYGAAKARPNMPGTSVAYVNAFASVVILVGMPMLGLTFSLPGDGRIGFVIIAVIWVLSVLALPSRKLLGLEDPPSRA